MVLMIITSIAANSLGICIVAIRLRSNCSNEKEEKNFSPTLHTRIPSRQCVVPTPWFEV